MAQRFRFSADEGGVILVAGAALLILVLALRMRAVIAAATAVAGVGLAWTPYAPAGAVLTAMGAAMLLLGRFVWSLLDDRG